VADVVRRACFTCRSDEDIAAKLSSAFDERKAGGARPAGGGSGARPGGAGRADLPPTRSGGHADASGSLGETGDIEAFLAEDSDEDGVGGGDPPNKRGGGYGGRSGFGGGYDGYGSARYTGDAGYAGGGGGYGSGYDRGYGSARY